VAEHLKKRKQSVTVCPSQEELWPWLVQWPKQEPLVEIWSFFLADNHFHLLLKEIRQDGMTQFMSKIGIGFTGFINLKYDEVGRLFQSVYRSKVVKDLKYLQHLVVYILLVNFMETYPNGYELALKDFNKLVNLAADYKFSSFPDIIGNRNTGIITKPPILKELFPDLNSFKEEWVREVILKKRIRQSLKGLAID